MTLCPHEVPPANCAACWDEIKQAKRERRVVSRMKGPRHMSDAKKEEKGELRILFHDPVLRRDGGYCQLCFLRGKGKRVAKYGDHLQPQGQSGTEKTGEPFDTRMDPRNGAAICDECNAPMNRNGLLAWFEKSGKHCVMQFYSWSIQTEIGETVYTFSRLVSRTTADEWESVS